jgi:hypothetical protein
MALVTSGEISIGGSTSGRSINLELGRAATANSSLDEASLRALAGIASGTISLSNFYGKSSFRTFFMRAGTNATDQTRSIDVDPSGNIHTAGDQQFGGCVSKFNADGTFSWARSLSGTSLIIETVAASSSGVYVSGRFSPNSSTYGTDGVLFRFGSDGGEQWKVSLRTGSNFEERINGSTTDASGNLYVVGTASITTLSTGRRIFVAKITSQPGITWQRVFGSDAAFGEDVAVDSNGNVYVAGTRNSPNDVIVLKYNSSGVLQWQRTMGSGLGSAFREEGIGIDVDSSGNCYVVGRSTFGDSAISTGYKIIAAKFDTNGTFEWLRSLNTTNENDYGLSCAVSSSGDLYVIGYYNIQTSSNAGLVAKYNSSGVLQWQRSITYGSSTLNVLFGAALNSDGGVYFAGWSNTGYGGADQIIGTMPADGSKTGTYGSWNYAAASLTAASETMTITSTTLTDAAGQTTLFSAVNDTSVGSLTLSAEVTNY